MKMRIFSAVLVSAVLSTGMSQCSHRETSDLARDERLITILQTNDIHGGIEHQISKDGAAYGGMAMLSGIVQSVREGLNERYGHDAGTLVVDAGDQFQGTLLSNFDEGQVVFATMNQIGYDAVVPGNHDYDFGPIGWLDDTVTPQTEDQNSRGALDRLVSQAKFPLLSANTYFKKSIVDISGAPLEVNHVGCAPIRSDAVIDWGRAERPGFLKPYVVKNVAGIKVALIGIDNVTTPQTTSISNISDLCFDDEVQAYLRTRNELEGQADVFVVVMHDGNINNELNASKFAEKVTDPQRGPLVDAIVAGHTHAINHELVNQIPIVQSGSGGKLFGRIDLIWNTKTKAVDRAKTRFYAGVQMWHQSCAAAAEPFCKIAGTPLYEGVATEPDPAVLKLIGTARQAIAPISERKLGVAEGKLYVDRIKESPLANLLTDTLRQLAEVEVAFMNTGGIRTLIEKGDITYSKLFEVLPFNNHGVIVGPMSSDRLLALLKRSIGTCGEYGALMQSGLKVVFERDCTKGNGTDPNARLLHVETLRGDVILDVATRVEPNPRRSFTVATLDFLAAGGSGYEAFKGVPFIRDLGIAREAMTEQFIASEQGGALRFTPKLDGRWKELQRQPSGPAPQGNGASPEAAAK